MVSSITATMSNQNKADSGAGQFVPLSKTFRPNKNTTNDFVMERSRTYGSCGCSLHILFLEHCSCIVLELLL